MKLSRDELALLRLCMLTADQDTKKIWKDEFEPLLNKITKELRK
jgi:hypothetical protein